MLKYVDILITVILTALLTVVMLWPIKTQFPGPEASDKLLHLLAFLALVLPFACTGRFRLLPILISASIFGGTIELIQPFFGRSAELGDWISDIVGVSFGIILGKIYNKISMH